MIRLSEAVAWANCTNKVNFYKMISSLPNSKESQITPAYVCKAYTLLWQSIIHVEQDDFDFDEEELEGECDKGRPHPPTSVNDMDGEDLPMMAGLLRDLSIIDVLFRLHDHTLFTLGINIHAIGAVCCCNRCVVMYIYLYIFSPLAQTQWELTALAHSGMLRRTSGSSNHPKVVICRCKSHCTVYNTSTSLYEGEGHRVSCQTWDNHKEDDNALLWTRNGCRRSQIP